MFIEDMDGLSQGEERSWDVESMGDIQVTLVYTDAPGALIAQRALVNDLDLELHNGATVYYPNHGNTKDAINNVENIDINSETASSYRISVKAARVPNGISGKQPFALVVSYE